MIDYTLYIYVLGNNWKYDLNSTIRYFVKCKYDHMALTFIIYSGVSNKASILYKWF